MSWQPEADDIAQRRAWSREHGDADVLARYKANGWKTVRERIDLLADPDSFQEIGQLAGAATYDGDRVVGVTPSGFKMGLADIDGRPVVVGGDDFSVRGGSSAGHRPKGGHNGFSGDLAFEYRIPLVNLYHGAGGSVAGVRSRGYALYPGSNSSRHFAELLGHVPVVSAVMGTSAGGPAGRAVLSHFSVMVRGTSQLFASGPPVVKRALNVDISKEDLGGAKVAVDKAGTIDNAVDSEEECLATIRRFLSYMPQNVWELPPRVETDDPKNRREEALLSIVPRNRRMPYDMKKLLKLVVDRDSFFEIQPTFGRSVIAGLARLDGYVVGIIANTPMFNGGAIDGAAARKQTRMIDLCDTFHIPIVFMVDAPGFAIGPDAEQAGALREGMRCMQARMQATVPIISVVVRRCFGFGGMVTRDNLGLDFKVAWPSAQIGSLPLEGGVLAAYRREIESADDPQAKQREIEQELLHKSSPFSMAEAFAIEDLIDPRETRPYLCRFIRAMQSRLRVDLGPKGRIGPRV
ncbi:acyl-CoA carboxylase subunit beta [Hydrogenophaga sp. BPS33]|uniref:acyl-CoA carboxylase subunit beta n=1 Tax=Hydrogenophaga sp. BPS33 TaxID=2651974 RepID=UPI00131F90F1|nr:carboxyl transferase domain-containing protein [Hydrogenophaga sp. BPS33]QHE84260.1 propionyl-CoA carboxylase [Hydrogenophaga sp. BPS33]